MIYCIGQSNNLQINWRGSKINNKITIRPNSENHLSFNGPTRDLYTQGLLSFDFNNVSPLSRENCKPTRPVKRNLISIIVKNSRWWKTSRWVVFRKKYLQTLALLFSYFIDIDISLFQRFITWKFNERCINWKCHKIEFFISDTPFCFAHILAQSWEYLRAARAEHQRTFPGTLKPKKTYNFPVTARGEKGYEYDKNKANWCEAKAKEQTQIFSNHGDLH